MPDYSKAVIYTIKTGDSLYVGSTINFSNRKYDHKKILHGEHYRNHNVKVYKTIRENNFEWDMKIHKEFPCENKTQLCIEEERVRVELKADLNSYTCHGFDDDYYKKYYIKNKDKIKQYEQDNKEHIKERKKQYVLNNIEKTKENKKIHYEKNKEIIRIKNKEKTICECGCEIRKNELKRHQRSAKHIKLMESKI
tara:strand:+ start:108 stop:692 length:585 start_codon:yes stop_codon:yes gene_type:complete